MTAQAAVPESALRAFVALRAKMARRRVPAFMSLELTHRCNLRCVHCYLGDSRAAAVVDAREIGERRWSGLIDELVAAGCLEVLLTGGEPLLRRDFGAIYRRAREGGLMVTVFTNATLVSRDTVELFRDLPPNGVEVTLYGATERTYESVTGVPGSHRRCVAGIRALREAGVDLRLKAVALTANSGEIPAMESLARELGCPFRLDPAVFPRFDGSRAPLAYRLPPREAVELEFADPARASSWRSYHERCRDLPVQDGLYTCGAGLTAGNITPAGMLTPCLLAQEPAVDVRDAPFAQGWRDAIPAVRSLTPGGHYRCNSCERRSVCGFCPAFFALESGEADVCSAYLCELGAARLERLQRTDVAKKGQGA